MDRSDFDLKIQTILKDLGLSSVQTEYYIRLVKQGGSTASKLAKDIGINRTNSYAVIDRLKSLDLIWEENRPTGKIIHPKSYKSILNALSKKEKRLEEYKSNVQSLSPIFDSMIGLQNTTGPKVRVYEDEKGLDNIINDILYPLSENKEILLFTNQETEVNFFTRKRHDDFITQRIESNIKIRALAIDNKEGLLLRNTDKSSLRETRLLPSNFSFKAEVYIYDNKISMIDIKKSTIGVIIESEELYKIQKQLFETLWNIVPTS